MDSSNGKKSPDNVTATPITTELINSRIRTDSESSDRQMKFVLPGAAGSPPKVLTLDEVQKAVTGVENMALAHEIAVNPSFRLEPYVPPEDSLERKFKDMFHKAFWSLLREDLAKDPPCYDHAIQLLEEIKDDFHLIITKNNDKALARICEVLDTAVIRQLAEQGVLEFESYADFIIQIMAKSCAPIRDEQVAKLSEIKDVVDTFRGIFETMALMKLDIANCFLNAARKDVIAHSVEYEKEKFKEFLDVYNYGFPATESWLMRNMPTDTTPPNWRSTAIQNAYIELLDWNMDNEFPEILAMDKDRLTEISAKALQVCICACIAAILQSIPVIGQNAENKKALMKEVAILLQGATINKDIEDLIENVWLHVKTVINKKLKDAGSTEMDEQTENAIKGPILQLYKKDSPVRSLIGKRLVSYALIILSAKVIPPPPPGYTDFADELQFLAAFKAIVLYNYTVFGEQYHNILNEMAKKSSNENDSTTQAGPSSTSLT